MPSTTEVKEMSAENATQQGYAFPAQVDSVAAVIRRLSYWLLICENAEQWNDLSATQEQIAGRYETVQARVSEAIKTAGDARLSFKSINDLPRNKQVLYLLTTLADDAFNALCKPDTTETKVSKNEVTSHLTEKTNMPSTTEVKASKNQVTRDLTNMPSTTEVKVFASREEADQQGHQDAVELIAELKLLDGRLMSPQRISDTILVFQRVYRNAVADEPFAKSLQRAQLSPNGKELQH